MLRELFVTQPIVSTTIDKKKDPIANDNGSGQAELALKQSLDAKQLVLLGIGAVVGTGIFVLTGSAAALYAGPALVISFIVASATCALAALCYAEFASMLPVSGSAYAYSYATLGEIVAWFIGWNLVLEYVPATAAVGWSAYFNELLRSLSSWTGIQLALPSYLVSAPFTFDTSNHLVATGAILNVPAVLIIAALGWLCYRGINQSAIANAIIVTVKVAIIVLFLVVSVHFIHPSFWHPFIPPNEAGYRYGWSGIFRGATLVFFAYIGFDAVATTAGEAKNPRRDMPIGILGSLLVCTLLYVAVSATLTGLAPFRSLNTAKPVATALDYVLGNVATGSTTSLVLQFLKGIIVFGALAGLSSVILVLLLALARTFYSMAQDGLLPKVLGRIHPRNHTPHISTLAACLVCATLSGLFPVDVLGDVVSMSTLPTFATVCIGVLVLRRTRPDLPRAFRVPCAWLVCPLAAATCLFLFWQVFTQRWWL